MFPEALLSIFLLGVLAGGLIGVVFGVIFTNYRSTRPAQAHIAFYRGRSIRHLALAEQARKPHLGTPYLRREVTTYPPGTKAGDAIRDAVDAEFPAPTPLPLDVAYALTDTHSGSRRADKIEQFEREATDQTAERLNVVPMQVQTGRPV